MSSTNTPLPLSRCLLSPSAPLLKSSAALFLPPLPLPFCPLLPYPLCPLFLPFHSLSVCCYLTPYVLSSSPSTPFLSVVTLPPMSSLPPLPFPFCPLLPYPLCPLFLPFHSLSLCCYSTPDVLSSPPSTPVLSVVTLPPMPSLPPLPLPFCPVLPYPLCTPFLPFHSLSVCFYPTPYALFLPFHSLSVRSYPTPYVLSSSPSIPFLSALTLPLMSSLPPLPFPFCPLLPYPLCPLFLPFHSLSVRCYPTPYVLSSSLSIPFLSAFTLPPMPSSSPSTPFLSVVTLPPMPSLPSLPLPFCPHIPLPYSPFVRSMAPLVSVPCSRSRAGSRVSEDPLRLWRGRSKNPLHHNKILLLVENFCGRNDI